MTSSVANSFLYENLQVVSVFNQQTKLCIYEPTHKLYIVKTADPSCKPTYETIQSLNNPHLAKIIHIEDKKDHIEIVREYLSGDTLADLVKNHKRLKTDTALKIAADICDGLADVHKMGFVHRDITPNNIIVSPDGCARIIDFGIARDFSKEKKSDTNILGTPGYAAPEQFGFSQSDARTDIYAIGVLLNVMLTGYLPNEREVKGALGKTIKKCIEIDYRHRYESMNDLKNALNNKVSDNSPMDKIVKQIPGIRSHNVVVVILAAVGYLCAILFSAAAFAAAPKGTYFQTFLAWIFCFPIPFSCFHNFLDIWNKLPFSKGGSHRNQRVVYTILGILSILFGLIIFGLINTN